MSLATHQYCMFHPSILYVPRSKDFDFHVEAAEKQSSTVTLQLDFHMEDMQGWDMEVGQNLQYLVGDGYQPTVVY